MKRWIQLLILLSPLVGQTQERPVPNNRMAYNWPYFRLNGERLSHAETKGEFSKVPKAYFHYKKYRTQLYIGLAAIVSSVIFLYAAEDRRIETGKDNTGLYVTACGLSITSLITILSALNNRKKTVSIYNEPMR